MDYSKNVTLSTRAACARANVYSHLVDELGITNEEFNNALSLYIEVNREDFVQAISFWINEWRKPLQDTDIVELT